MKEITHEEFLKLRKLEQCHLDCMEIGSYSRDGACWMWDESKQDYLQDCRLGYVIERITTEDFKLHRPVITGVPIKKDEEDEKVG